MEWLVVLYLHTLRFISLIWFGYLFRVYCNLVVFYLATNTIISQHFD